MSEQSGVLSEGARRVWRYQRALWWFFGVNFILAFFGAVAASMRLGQVADHSLASQRLVQGFDVATFIGLTSHPDVALWSNTPGSFLLALVFFVFALFFTGGLLEAYHAGRKLPTGEFFHACGAFFWRWVRLLIFLLIVLAPVTLLAYWMNHWSGTLSDDAPQEKLGFWVELGGILLALFAAMVVRLWFDMAQVHTVGTDERAMRRSLVRGCKITFRNFGSLFWLYFRLSFLAWLGLALGLWLWIRRIPAQRTGLSFLVLELTLLWWTGTRFWQRASEVVWYQRRATAPVALPAPEPAEPSESLPVPPV